MAQLRYKGRPVIACSLSARFYCADKQPVAHREWAAGVMG
jgi:hypothetical protein